MAEFTEHRTRDELNELLRHAHFIAVGKGYTAKFVEKNYSGWHWNELIRMLRMGGVVRKGEHDRLRCDPKVVGVRFGRGSTFQVEWDWMG
ncbi:hypothetical protein [Aeromicrobium duanguangcaii]|uniref:Uncharacterized protein n=1 Tax=Aeromicrobium duanguangcaii TaxID=2968086 RepID=A0ABY5KBG5_9ACTN|nr:hypothetical protein [Aeromicrobium duanguangcaii]MCD9154784.1 hypothetical protein [Aeromicrobium duanguangcaii]UUI67801.1 hypothetical protein NP095_11410 [Aeromicrobium duanguangcaii]